MFTVNAQVMLSWRLWYQENPFPGAGWELLYSCICCLDLSYIHKVGR